MKTALLGALRGLGYALIFFVLDYISKHIGETGLVSASASTLITMGIASFEHYLTSLPTTPTITQ